MDIKHLKKQLITNIRISKTKTLYDLYKNNEKIQAYITVKGIKFIKKMYPHLECVDYVNQDIPSNKLKNYVYSTIITRPSSNHPFVIFANIDSNIIHIVHPFGKDRKDGQIDLDIYEKILLKKHKNKVGLALYYAIYLIIGESIKIRKEELIFNDKFSLLKCSNIKQCRLNVKKMNKKRINPKIKNKEIKKYNELYEKKAIKMIKKYYDLLEEREFEEAYNFLKVKKGKYFKKQRLNTFFVNSKKLIGHLQILIDLYQLVFRVVDNYKTLI